MAGAFGTELAGIVFSLFVDAVGLACMLNYTPLTEVCICCLNRPEALPDDFLSHRDIDEACPAISFAEN